MFKSFLHFTPLFLILSFPAQSQEIFKGNSFGAGFNFTFGYQAVEADKYFANEQIGTKDGKPVLFNLGYNELKNRELSDGSRLNSYATYAKPTNTLLTAGFQGLGAFNSILLGGELNYLFGSKEFGSQTDSIFVQGSFFRTGKSETSSRFMGGDAMLDIGFVGLRKRGLIIYPMIGIGYSAIALWLQQTDQVGRRLFPEPAGKYSASENKQNTVFWTSNLAFDFGLGFQYMVGASTEDRAKGFSIGFRTGYKMQLPTDDINVNSDYKSSDAYSGNVSLPKLGNQGFYIKLLVGFGKIGDNR